MISPPLESTHGERCRAWQDITALGLYALCDDIGSCMTSLPFDSTHGRQLRAWHDITALGKHTRSDKIVCEMPSLSFQKTHYQTTSSMACHNLLLTTHTTIRHLVSHAIFALRLHARSNDLGLGMPTWTLGSINCRTTSGVTCYIALGQHTRSDYVGHVMPAQSMGNAHNQTILSFARHHNLWEAHRIG